MQFWVELLDTHRKYVTVTSSDRKLEREDCWGVGWAQHVRYSWLTKVWMIANRACFEDLSLSVDRCDSTKMERTRQRRTHTKGNLAGNLLCKWINGSLPDVLKFMLLKLQSFHSGLYLFTRRGHVRNIIIIYSHGIFESNSNVNIQ